MLHSLVHDIYLMLVLSMVIIGIRGHDHQCHYRMDTGGHGGRQPENWLQYKSLHAFTLCGHRVRDGVGAKSAPQWMGLTPNFPCLLSNECHKPPLSFCRPCICEPAQIKIHLSQLHNCYTCVNIPLEAKIISGIRVHGHQWHCQSWS